MRKFGVKIKFFVVLFSVFAIGTSLHSAYYPEIGRFISRDPIEEPGFQANAQATGSVELLNALVNKKFEPEYTIVNNNPISRWDFLGLAWKISRQGDARAKAERDSVTKDTIGILASSVQLNESEALKWLRNKDGSKVSAKDLKTKCSFQIPNTVIAYWAGELGGVGRWWVNWNSNIDNLKKTGYMVNEYDGSENTASHHYQNLLHSAVAESQLYGTYYWGHGNTKGLANSTDKHYLLEYSNLKITYKIGFAHIYACESNSGKSAFNSTIWTGFTGTLYPINPWDFDWDNPSTP